MLVAVGLTAIITVAAAFGLVRLLGSSRAHHTTLARPGLGVRDQAGYPARSDTGPLASPLRQVPGQVSGGPGWRYDPRGWVEVYGRGAVLSGLSLRCNINVAASDVTIKDVRIVTGGPTAIGISLRHARDVTVADSRISGRNTGKGRLMAGVKDVFGDSTGVRVLYNNIAKFETGVQLETGLVKGNYIHDPGFMAGDHTNGIMSNGGNPGMLTIDHNTILIDRGQTDAIGLFEDFGVQENRLITDNLLAGGGYAIYAGQKRGGAPTSNIVIRGNQISTKYFAKGGYYGCITAFNPRGAKDRWSMNERDKTLVPSLSECDLAAGPGD